MQKKTPKIMHVHQYHDYVVTTREIYNVMYMCMYVPQKCATSIRGVGALYLSRQ